MVASGCSGGLPIPTPVTIATYAADGVSLLASGKTVSDHALSAAMDEDCALSRAFRGRLVCHEEGDTSDEDRYQALAAVYGPLSPLTSPFDLTPIDSVASVGEYEGNRLPAEPRPQVVFGPQHRSIPNVSVGPLADASTR